jgi:hypothetical protein
LISKAHYFKLSADEGSADGQRRSGRDLRDATDLSKDLISIAHYFKLSADQGNAFGQRRSSRYLRDGIDISTDLISTAHYFKLSADPEVLTVSGDMANVSEMGQIFQKIWSQEHIISNFQPTKEVLMVNGDLAEIFEM